VVQVEPDIDPPDYVTRAEYSVDGLLVATVDRKPFSFAWSTQGVSPGDHLVAVKVHDTVGNTAEASRTLQVMAPLSVRLTHPTEGGTGEPLASVTVAPFAYEWDTSGATAGAHSLTARATGQGESAEHGLQVVVEGTGLPIGLIVALGVIAVAAVPFLLMMRRREPAEAPPAGVTREISVGPEVAAPTGAWLEDTGGRRWPLRAEGIQIGRHVGPSGIPVDDALASRQHGEVRFENGEYVYFDLGATNPALINGQEQPGSQVLRDGDVLTIGDTSLVFRLST
jgi:hypothetical protein